MSPMCPALSQAPSPASNRSAPSPPMEPPVLRGPRPWTLPSQEKASRWGRHSDGDPARGSGAACAPGNLVTPIVRMPDRSAPSPGVSLHDPRLVHPHPQTLLVQARTGTQGEHLFEQRSHHPGTVACGPAPTVGCTRRSSPDRGHRATRLQVGGNGNLHVVGRWLCGGGKGDGGQTRLGAQCCRESDAAGDALGCRTRTSTTPCCRCWKTAGSPTGRAGR